LLHGRSGWLQIDRVPRATASTEFRWPFVWHHHAATEASLDPSDHELRTDRLRLVPLDADGMGLFVDDWPALQRRLGLTPSPAWATDRDTLEAARRHRQEMRRDPDAWLWWTFWQVILVSSDVSIGLVDFKGPPAPDGGIAVGCVFAPTYWGRGYATEAVDALLAMTRRQPAVRYISAETDVTNVRAQRLLRNLGFRPLPEGQLGNGPPPFPIRVRWVLVP
jgi:ribosomal-protein-alanine N-acetyltransferase